MTSFQNFSYEFTYHLAKAFRYGIAAIFGLYLSSANGPTNEIAAGFQPSPAIACFALT